MRDRLLQITLLAFLSFFWDWAHGHIMEDLMIVDYWNQQINDRMPVTFNHLLQGGYINMPSARMGCEGEVGSGFAYVKPYHIYSSRAQILDRLEVTLNYRVFRGIEDPLLSPFGFGDLSDKGANVKYAILHPEDTDYKLPGIAVGFEDFLGTKAFESRYLVFTQVFLKKNLELSVGIGAKRIRRWFGGLLWMPFRRCDCSYIKDLAFVAEYDATPYKSKKFEPHPDGRMKKSPINYGIKYRLWDHIDLSASYIRGVSFAYSASVFYDFGSAKGFIPKINDPLPYRAPVITEPINHRRPEDVMAHDLIYAFRKQGFDIYEMWLLYNHCCQKTLRIRMENDTYRYESDIRCRLNNLLAFLVPSDIAEVVVVVDTEGLPVHEYRFPMKFVRMYGDRRVGPYELQILTPMFEASSHNRCYAKRLYKKRKDWWNFGISPKTHTLFGSATGKFKYSLGINFGFQGYLFNDIYYSLLFGYNIVSDLYDVKDVDKLNPSQIVNVRTDIVEYFKQEGITVDEAYIQKNWNICRGWYSRFAAGLFEEQYGGLASEVLYYPVNCRWAVGIEGALLKKRTVDGIGFTDKIRKLEGFKPTFKRFSVSQYFFDLYYEWKEADLDFKVMVGKFLANDKGARLEISRYFPSGVRFNVWYTRTDGRDFINGDRYYDKGVAISIPLDLFYSHSSRSYWSYGLSAWLRDVGAISSTGDELYYMIYDERHSY